MRELFGRTFGKTPDVVASAPGRVNLIGEHVDYNGGVVLPIAVDQRTWVAVRRSGGRFVRAVSATQKGTESFDPSGPARSGGWSDYLAGIALELSRQHSSLPGCDIAVWSDLPVSAGLSSSAALCVAGAAALARLIDLPVSAREIAEMAHRAEADFVGVPCGIMDQFASALAREGHALHLDCETAVHTHVPFADGVFIFDTGVARTLRGSAFALRRAECDRAVARLRDRWPTLRTLAQATPAQIRDAALPPPLDRRARHVTEEVRRVAAFVDALMEGRGVSGEILLDSHRSLRDDYDCSIAELDWFVERAMTHAGVSGARLTGAGWGGCALAVGDEGALEVMAPLIASEYRAAFPHQPRWWITRAREGVQLHE
ncbi:MAG: galactokinase [Gemmatimonadota bacterium]|nr:galactokinase [Gemmatimonadota bacterium]